MRLVSTVAVVAYFASTVSATVNASTAVGDYVSATVKSTIAADTKGVINAFAGTLPPEVRSTVVTALNLTVLQKLSGATNATQLDTLSSAITNKLTAIQKQVHDGITNSSTFLGQPQGANYTDLRNCIAQVVQQAGMESGQRCLMLNNTAAVSDIKAIFRKVINQFEFLLPIDTVTAVQTSVNDYLSKSALLPAAQQLVKDTQASILSVTAATAGDTADAIYRAEACFFEALSQPVYTAAYEYTCNVTPVNGTSALNSIQNIYRDTVNQYAGVLPPRIVESIQKIGDASLSPTMSAADKATRDDINKAVLSVVASTSGNEATITYQLLDCINLILVPGAGNMTTAQACMNSPTGLAASRLNIINGYLQQFYGVLPPKLILDLEDKVAPALSNASYATADKTRTNLNNLFTASGAGPAYVTCFETYENCVVNAMGNVTASTTCPLGTACQSKPFLTPVIDETSPYAAAASAIAKAKANNKPNAQQQRDAFAAAARAARMKAEGLACRRRHAQKPKSNKRPAKVAKKPTRKPSRKGKATKAPAKAKKVSAKAKAQTVKSKTQKNKSPVSRHRAHQLAHRRSSSLHRATL